MKNDKELKKITSTAKRSVYLEDKEKQIMKSEILAFMKNYPFVESDTSFSRASFVSFQSPVLRFASILSVISLIVFSGVSFAANRSLPGEVLYPVKVGVNEKVLGLLQISDESKAHYDVKLAELRLQEIEEISTKKGLNEEVKLNISILLNKHIENVKKRSLKIENRNNPEISLKINSELEASLKAHKVILDELSKEKNSEASENIKGVISNVNEEISNIKKERQVNEDTFSNNPSPEIKQSAEGKLKAVENKIEEVSNFIEKNKSSLSEDSYETAKINLGLAKSTIEEGKDYLESEDYSEAFLTFQKAIRIAQQTQISVQASINLEINVIEIKEQNGDSSQNENKGRNEEYGKSNEIKNGENLGLSVFAR